MSRSAACRSCLSVVCWATTAAYAETADMDTPAQLGEVIVTAQKRSEKLSEVPISIIAATRDELVSRGINGPADLEKLVPGFVFTASAYGAPIYTLRGLGFFNEALGATPTVSIYVDQAPLPYSALTEGAALDIARVEILKGPQGTFFGQNSTGGAINYIAARPTAAFTAGTSLTVGNLHEADASGFISGPITKGLTARFAVQSEHRNGWRRNYEGFDDEAISRNTNGVRAFDAARLLADWRASDTLRLQFNLNGWLDQSDTQAKQKIAYAPLTPVSAGGYPDSPGWPNLQANLASYPNAPNSAYAAGFDPEVSLRRNDRFHQATIRVELDVSPRISLTSISTYSHLEVDRPSDGDGTIYPDIFIAVVGSIDSISQELRLAGTALPHERLKWMIGGNYAHDRVDDTQHITDNGSNTGIGSIRFQTADNINNQRISTGSIFGSLDFSMTDTLAVQGSLRYTRQRDEFRGCLADSGRADGSRSAFAALSTALSGTPTVIQSGSCITLGADDKPVAIVARDLDENNVSYRASMSWKIRPQALVYGSITQGYKAGAFDTLPAIRPAQLNPVQQESVLGSEVGFKAFSAERHLEANGAVFYYDYQDKQIEGYVDTGPPFGTLPALVSIPKSHVTGAELDATLRPARGVTLSVAGSYLETAVEGSFVTSTPLGAAADIGGQGFPNAPRWQLTSDVEYDFPISGKLAGFVGSGFSYRSSTVAAFADGPLFDVPPYGLLDVRGGVRAADGRWSVDVWARNLTNRFYWTAVEHVQDTVIREAGIPATYGVTWEWRL